MKRSSIAVAIFAEVLRRPHDLEWQTLIAGLLALGVGFVTALFLWLQLQFERKKHKDEVYRKSLAARARMPDALTELCAFTERAMQYLDGRKNAPPRAKPTDAINVLKNAIQYLDRQSALKVFELVSWYQVHNAWLYGDPVEPNAANHADRMYQTVLLRYYVDRLYEYARNEVEVVPDEPEGREDMITALTNAAGLPHYVQHRDDYAAVRAIIERRHKPAAQGS